MYLLDTSVTDMVRNMLQTVIPRHAGRDLRAPQKGKLYYQYVSERSGTDDAREEHLPFLAIGGLFLIIVTVMYAVAA